MDNSEKQKSIEKKVLNLITEDFDNDPQLLVSMVKRLTQKGRGRKAKPRHARAEFYILIYLIHALSTLRPNKALSIKQAIRIFIEKEIIHPSKLITKSTLTHSVREPSTEDQLERLYYRLNKEAEKDPEWMDYTFSEIEDELNNNS